MICRPFCKKPDNSTVPAGRPTGVRRTLLPPTTPLESHPCTMRACKVLRITFLRKNRGRGSHYVNHPTLLQAHAEICGATQHRYIGTCFSSPPEWYRHAIVARNSLLQYHLHAGVARKRLRPSSSSER